MAIPARPQKVSIDAQGYVTFSCPYCRTSRTASVARYRDLHAPITVECDCEQLFDILIDTRHFYRQHLRLSGTYLSLESTTPQRITVKTLSASGVSFRTLSASPLQIDDEVTLCFQLDDMGQTALRLKAIVRWVQDVTVGAEFGEHHGYEEVLGSYLRLRRNMCRVIVIMRQQFADRWPIGE